MKAPLGTQFCDRRWLLEWRWLTYLRNIILQGYVQIYPVPCVHLPFQANLDFEPVRLADSEGHQIYSERNTGDWWWDTQDQLHTTVTIVPVICASDMTHWTNVSSNQHTWPLYLMIGDIWKGIHCTPKSAPAFPSGISHVPKKVPKTMMKHGIRQLELCCLNLGILTSLAVASCGILQMDSSEHFTLL